MRIDNVAGIFVVLMLCLGWWYFKDPAQASRKIDGLVVASRIWRS
jgi:hypothetical protein